MLGQGPPSTTAGRDGGVERDASLVRAIAEGDKAALAALYDEHSRDVLALATRMLGAGAAEDLLHDVFLEVWHSAAQYCPDRGSVRAWLMVRTRSRALDRLGTRVRDARAADKAGAQAALRGEPSQRGQGEAELDARRVGRLARELEPELVRVLDLAYFDGLSCSEIAKALDLPVGTVKSRLARALERLRTAVGLRHREARR